MITVVAALIKKDGKVLIARRSTGDESVFGKWEFPGGKVELNETEKTAIEREINEEFEITVKAIKFVANTICKYPNKTINLKLYECEYISGNLRLHDHFESDWVEFDKLFEYDLAQADIELLKKI